MPFPPAFIDEVIARNPIEDVVGQYVTLKRSGSNLFGLCPPPGVLQTSDVPCSGRRRPPEDSVAYAPAIPVLPAQSW